MSTSKLLLGIFEYLRKNGHPDPGGVLARAKKISKFETEFFSKSHEGMLAIPLGQARNMGFTDNKDMETMMQTVIAIDQVNLEATQGDVVKMHQMWVMGVAKNDGKEVRGGFIKNLNKIRDEISMLIGKTSTPIEQPDRMTTVDQERTDAVSTDNFIVKKVYTQAKQNPLAGLLTEEVDEQGQTSIIPIDAEERELESLIALLKEV